MEAAKPVATEPGVNPSVEAPTAARAEEFIPMDGMERQLASPEMPGYVTYWPMDRPGRIVRLLRQGWTFVTKSEIDFQTFKTIAGDVTRDGSQDLGDRICVYGGTDPRGVAINQYLMKIPVELWKRYEQAREMQSDRVVSALKKRSIGSEREVGEDAQHRYGPRTGNTLFDKKR